MNRILVDLYGTEWFRWRWAILRISCGDGSHYSARLEYSWVEAGQRKAQLALLDEGLAVTECVIVNWPQPVSM